MLSEEGVLKRMIENDERVDIYTLAFFKLRGLEYLVEAALEPCNAVAGSEVVSPSSALRPGLLVSRSDELNCSGRPPGGWPRRDCLLQYFCGDRQQL